MANRLKFCLFFLFALFSYSSSYAQVNCHAAVPAQVEVGVPFEYRLTLNAKPSSIASTSFGELKHVGGPHQGSSTNIVYSNGQTVQNQEYTFSYHLQASKVGTYTIPGTVFVVDGKQVKSNNVSVTIVEASAARQAQQQAQQQQQQQQAAQAPTLNKDEIFIKASASKSNPYQGEQVIVTYKLYIGPGVNGGFQSTNINLPTQSGLWTYQLGDPNKEAARSVETVNGKRYTVLEIKKSAVFPQKSGEITITPMEMELVARVIYQVQRGNSAWEQFFGGGQRAQDYQLNIKSNSIKLNVKPLPENGKPESFTGLVGNFSIKSNLSRETLNANDATNLTLTISGTGNLQHAEAPIINFPPDFDVADPQIKDNINTSGSTVTGSRTFEHVIIPRSQGEFTIPATAFSYFDLSTNSYKTLYTTEYQVTVEKGSGEGISTAVHSNQKDIKVLDRDIRYIKNQANAFRKKESALFLSAWYFILLLCPLLLFTLFLMVWRKRLEAQRNIIETRDRRANKVARKRLKKAQKLLQEEQMNEFYVEISHVLWGYMSDKFRIPLAQLSMDTVEVKLREKSLSDDAIQEFLSTLNQCEFARFAPGDSRQNMREMYELTLTFITKIEKK